MYPRSPPPPNKKGLVFLRLDDQNLGSGVDVYFTVFVGEGYDTGYPTPSKNDWISSGKMRMNCGSKATRRTRNCMWKPQF